MASENRKEMNMVTNLQDANILPLDITKRQVKYLINSVNKLRQKGGTMIARGKVKMQSIYPGWKCPNETVGREMIKRKKAEIFVGTMSAEELALKLVKYIGKEVTIEVVKR